MRKWLLSAIVALGSFGAFAAPSNADTICPISGTSIVAAQLNPGILQLFCDSTNFLDVDVQKMALPYGASASQTALASSFIGLGSVDASGYFQPLPSGVAGTTITGSRVGVPYFQGTGTNGAMPVTGNLSISGTTTVGGSTGTLAQTASGLQVDGSGVTQPVSIAATVPISTATSLPITASSPIPISAPTSLPITASSPLPVNINGSGTGTPTTATVTSTSSALLFANQQRVGVLLYNAGTVTVYVGLGFTPTTSSYTVPIPAGSLFELPVNFRGPIRAITAGTSDTVLVTELT